MNTSSRRKRTKLNFSRKPLSLNQLTPIPSLYNLLFSLFAPERTKLERRNSQPRFCAQAMEKRVLHSPLFFCNLERWNVYWCVEKTGRVGWDEEACANSAFTRKGRKRKKPVCSMIGYLLGPLSDTAMRDEKCLSWGEGRRRATLFPRFPQKRTTVTC